MPTVTKFSIGRFDGLKLLGSALLVAIIGISSFLVADYFHISLLTIFLGWMGVGFIAKVAEDFRGFGLFRRPSFLLFITAWLAIYLLDFAFTNWPLAMLLEGALGYFLAHKIFKVPYPWDVERDPRREAGQ